MNRRTLILILIIQFTLVGQIISRDIPSWSVTPADFQNSANLTATLDIDHVASTDPNDMLGAFVGEECRGVVSPVTMGESKLFFLTVYSNLNTEELTLKAYIADLDTIITTNESINFIPGAEYGTPTEPFQLNAIIFYDHTPVVTGISDQIIEIGDIFTSFDLDDYLTELDGDAVVWSSINTSNLSVSIDANNVATVNILDNEWVGSDSLFFIATDLTDSAFAGQDTVLFTILPIDHPPEITSIPDQTVGSGGSFSPIDLENYLIEQDGDSISWTLAFAAPTTTDPVPTWSLDPADYNSNMSLTAVVNSRGAEVLNDSYQLAAFVNGECRAVGNPVLALGELTFFLTIYANSDDETLDLRLYDASHQLDLPVQEQITFQTGVAIGSPETPVELNAGYIIAQINSNNQAGLTVVDPTWTGTEIIQFFAQDMGTLNSYNDSVSTSFTILPDHTPLVAGIADQTVETGSSFNTFDLDDYLTEVDGDDVNWSVTGNTDLTVSIDGDNVVSINPVVADWTGAESIIFITTDVSINQFSSSDTAIFTILPIDHAPEVSDIPDQLIGNGGAFSDIILNDYLTEIDGHTIQWTYHFDTPLTMDPVPTWVVNAADYESDMTLTASITSRGLALAQNDYSLAAFVGEECRGVANPVAFGDEWLFFLTIYANESGEALSFRLYDGSIALDMPILENLVFEPSTSIGTPEDPYTMTAGFIQLMINSEDEVEISSMDPTWSGTENVWFTATDLGTDNIFADSSLVSFTIMEDHTPLVSGIPDQMIELGGSFNILDLNDYVTELDNDDLSWSITGETNLVTLINPDLTVTILVNDDQWVGDETLVFTATDVTANELFSSDSATFTVIPIDHAPEISSIPNDTIGIGGEFLALDLSQYLQEQDGDQVTWSYSYATALAPVPSPNWTVTPTAFEHNMSLTSLITLRSVPSVSTENILAVFSGDDCRGVAQPVVVGENSLYFLTIYGHTNGEDLEFRIYDAQRQDTLIIHQSYTFLSNAVIGAPDDPELLTAQNLNLEFLTESTLLPAHAYPEWTGTEVIKIFAQDANTSNEYRDSTLVYFTVLPQTSPSFLTISDQEINEGDNFPLISLNDYLQFPEPEEVNWYVSSGESLQVSINDNHQLSVLTPHENWFGSETLDLELQRIDNPALNAYQSIQFNVLPINDAPVADSQDLTISEDSSLTITFSGSDIELDELNYILTMTPLHGSFTDQLYSPQLNYNGLDSLKYVAFDGDLFSDTATVILEVTAVNDLPVFTSDPQTEVLQDAFYQYQMLAMDIDEDSLIYSIIELPTWLSFDGINQISGVPGNEHVGNHQVRLTVTDTTEMDSLIWQVFAVTVENVNDAPIFASAHQDTAVQDQYYEYTLAASDIDEETLSFSVTELPEWLSFNSEDLLSGTPSNADVGEINIELIVSDLGGLMDTLDMHLIIENVNDLPVFTSIPVLEIEQNDNYQYQLTANDIDEDPLTYSVIIMPDWLSFNSIDLLSGMPTDEHVGIHAVEVAVTDGSAGPATTQAFNITVGNVNDPPQFINSNQDTVLQDMPYEYLLSATDPDGDTLSYLAEGYPAWLEFSAPDLLTGTPGNSDVGGYQITLFATDPQLAVDTLELQLQVQNVNDAPQFVSAALDTSLEDTQYEYELQAIDIDGDSLSYTVPILPEWLNFIEPKLLSGTPGNSDVGEYIISLIATDPFEAADTTSLSLLIQNVNDTPLADAGPDQDHLSGAIIHLDGSASSDIDGDDLFFEWSSIQTVEFTNGDSAIVTLSLPEVTEDTELQMRLRVFDSQLYSLWDTVSIVVNAMTEVTSTDFEDNPPVSGESITLEIEFPNYYSPLTAWLFYQVGGSSITDSVAMERVSRAQIWSAEIPATSVSETGLSYYAEAVDSQGNTVIIDTRSIPVEIMAGDYSMSTTLSSAFPSGVPASKWRLTSIPTNLNQTDLQNLFEIPLGENPGEQSWRLYDWNGESWETPDSILVGHGYWFQHRQEHSVDLELGDGRSVDLTGVDLQMQPGWNLFSSPYNFPITTPIDSFQFSGPYTYGDFGGEGWNSPGDTLKPWAAYALYNWADTLAVLTLHPQTETSALAKTINNEAGWRLQISADNGQLSDQMNWIGRSAAALKTRDAFDQAEPPAWDDYLSVHINNPDIDPRIHTYAADIRYADNKTEAWSIELAVGQDARAVDVKFKLMGDLPADHVNILVDIQQRTWVELGGEYAITGLNMQSEFARRYEIVNGPASQVYAKVQDLLSALPESNMLSANYPNPFNGGTNIEYSLRNPARVHLDIYDIRGRLVQTLVNEVHDMGFYSITWNGLNKNLKPVSSGIYLYRLTIAPVGPGQPYQSTRKMVMVR